MTKENYHHGDLKNALIEAGKNLLIKKGFSSLSLRELAKEAGVSHSAPYRHFSDKTEVLTAIAETGFRDLSAAMENISGKYIDDPQKQLIESGIAYILLAVKNPEIFGLMFGGILDCPEELSEAGNSSFQGLVKIIENGQKAGIYKDMDSQILTLSAWSTVHGISMLINAGLLKDSVKNEDEIRELAGLICTNLLQGILK